MKLACYCRYSSDMQREESIEAQLRAIYDWAEKNGHIIIKEYIDKAISGKTDDRPDFLAMIKDSNEAAWDGIVVHKLDRFSRNRYNSAIYKKKLKDNNKKIFSVLENLNDAPESIILESVLEGMNEYYIANLARETKKGLNENAYQCKFNGGIPPLGYDVEKGKYIINQKEAEIVKEIFKLYLSGYGLLKIALELNLKGYKTKRGNSFGKNSLFDILGNERYTGVYIYNQSINSNKRTTSENIIKIEGGMPQIISKEDFEKVMKKRENNKKNSGSYKAKREYALSGLITCGLCGRKYFGNTTTRKRKEKIYKASWYKCSGKNKVNNCSNINVKCDDLENKIYNLIKEKLLESSSIESLINLIQEEYNKMCNDVNNAAVRTEQNIALLNKRIESYVEAIGNGLYSEEIKNSLQDAESKRAILREQLIAYKNLEKHRIIKEEDVEQVLKKDFKKLQANKSQLFHKWIKEIKITPDKAEVHFAILEDVALLNGGEWGIRTPAARNWTLTV